jgi:8-oxo-dGTP pyrophosphatase MutT (NUDIX family)
MLLRDAPELQVFMLRRNPQILFAPGASVFPGGAVDDADRDPELLARCRGRDDRSASRLLGQDRGGLGYWVAAIREAFEEAGVMLAACTPGSPSQARARATAVGGAAAVAESVGLDGLADARTALARGEQTFLDLVAAGDLMLDCGALHPFAHWITPPLAPRRYDTWFFAAAAPEGQTYRHDDHETVASGWVTPAEALRLGAAGDIELILPTQRSLELLRGFRSSAAFLDSVTAAAANVGPLLRTPTGMLDLEPERVAG